MTTQLGLFGDIKIEEPEPMTEVRLGHRAAQYPLRKKRREAIAKLLEILEQLEGKDIHVGSYGTGGRHFWLDNLKLPRLRVDFHPYPITKPGDYTPGVIVLWGNRSSQVRIFTDYLVAVREQEYQGYFLYLLDFRNGFWENRLDEFRSHYACLTITRFKD